jgi:hypothetical protein
MAIIAKDKGGEDFAPIPAAMHHAVCYGVVDIGTQPSNNPKFPPRRKVIFTWEIPGILIEVEKDGVTKQLPRSISERFTLSLSTKSNLRPMLEGWRGRAFTEEELDGFDIQKVAGANCLLNIVHERKNDKTYANVGGVNPLMKEMAKIKPVNPLLLFSLDDFKGKITFPTTMPAWIQGLIMQSDEYIAREQRASSSTVSDDQAANIDPNANPDNCPF